MSNEFKDLLDATRITERGYKIDMENAVRREVGELVGHLLADENMGDEEVTKYVLGLVQKEIRQVIDIADAEMEEV
jgi:hypothetical protein